MALGFLWGLEFPVIKKIWTSSYVLVAGGFSAMLLGVFYWIVDVKKYQTWCQPFVWIGMNPIALYLISNFMGGLGYHKLATRLAGGSVKNFFDTHVADGFGELLISAISVALFYGLPISSIAGKSFCGFRSFKSVPILVSLIHSSPGQKFLKRARQLHHDRLSVGMTIGFMASQNRLRRC